ncbi:MAG: DNA helicase RecQ [Bacteroidia bacterium]|nr:DNA helicase RecQ [Bacteroidia bacterium]MCF8427335.1 DNA helicase RecQ [Bacteroidia bacterium]
MAAAKRAKDKQSATTPDLKEALRNYFGFDSFKGEQEEIIHNLLSGNDTFVIMPTGGGKSVCYQLPALIMPGTAIIISPLIALMKNQVDAIRSLSHESVAHFLNSSLNKGEITAVKKDINAGQTKMLYIAPETLKKDETIEFLKTIDISFVAVDEAHCISEWGHDFRPEYRRIKQMVKEIKDVPLIALTATATPKVQSDIIKNLQMTDATVYKSSFNRSNLYYEVRSKGKKGEAIKEIVSFIKARPNKTGIIYCLSRKRVDEISGILQANGIKALPYHAGLDAKVRADHQDKFLMEDADVIVATIAFGMGIDKPDVRFVIHYDIPKSIEGYYQETGRGGRDGLEGECILFYNPADIEKLEKFLKDKPVAEREIGELLIFETEAFAESSSCRRKFLLHYFGEEFPEKNCNKMCDNCRHPKEKVEAKESAVMALKVIREIKNKYNLKHCVDILIGNKTHEVAMSGHHLISSFGLGKEKDDNYWKSVIRQLLLRGLVTKNIENYGLLAINELGEAFIKKPGKFEMSVDRKFERFTDNDEDDSPVEAVYDEVLLAILKDLCKKVAKAKNLPPYIVFQEPSLQEMAFKYPITMEELSKITGVSAGKAAKFGKEFIGVIDKYVKDNNIERTEDVTIKSVVNKSARKIAIITNIDKRVSLDDIARGQGIKKEEILEEIENIVNSGTKLNLKKYVYEITEEEIVEEVMDFFRKTNENVMEAALKEYGEEFSKDDIHLMHIHFISEMAN